MGIQRTNAMGFLRGVIAVLLLASAVAVDRGEVTSLGENDPDPEHINWNVPDGDIVYRISWTNANQGEEMSTVGNVKIEITGAGGETTGELFVVTHPGMVCHGADSPRCRTDALGNVPTEKSRGSAKCGCDPEYAEYSEEDAKWTAEPTLHQQVYITAKDVGDIAEVKITSDVEAKWSMEGMKINTNSQMTGLGAGVFYVAGGKVSSAYPLEAKLSASTTEGDAAGSVEVGAGCSKNADCKTNMCDLDNSYKCEAKCLADSATKEQTADKNCPENTKSKITRCDAATCEEEMDAQFKLA